MKVSFNDLFNNYNSLFLLIILEVRKEILLILSNSRRNYTSNKFNGHKRKKRAEAAITKAAKINEAATIKSII